jgi:D-3-phosphoglycerate dehydrogenase
LKVVITDHPFPSADIEREALAAIGAQLVVGRCREAAEVIDLARDADGVLVTYAPITRAVIEALTRCKIIARMGIGLDNVDIPAASGRGIVVTNVPDYCVDEVSDHALALLLGCVRRLRQLDQSVRSGHWDFRPYRPIPRIRGKIIGLVGFGKIARAMARKCQGLGMQVAAFDPYIASDIVRSQGVVPLRSLEELLRESDFVSVHVPLGPDTRGLFGETEFSLMKQGAVLVNTARAEIVVEEALAQALASGRLTAAGLDVIANPRADHPLLAFPGVLISPHAAFFSEEATEELQTRAVGDVVRVLTGALPLNPVNPEVLAGVEAKTNGG